MTIGESIKSARTQLNLTQKQLAEKMGVDASMIRAYESGRRKPKPGTLRKFAVALNAPQLITEYEHSQELQHFSSLKEFKDRWDEIIESAKAEDEAENQRFQQVRKSFFSLNSSGQDEAVKRINELTQLPQYTEGRSQSVAIAHGSDGSVTITDQKTGEVTKINGVNETSDD